MNTKPLRLLLHDGTGQYFYGTEDDIVSSGCEIIDDVTGNKEHEKAAQAAGVTIAKALLDRRHAPILEHQKRIVSSGIWRTCLNCLHWTEVRTVINTNEVVIHHECSLFNAVPPPHIIVHGCRDHEDHIPF